MPNSSDPSTISEPVTIHNKMVADEFIPETPLHCSIHGLQKGTAEAWRCKYDFHRVTGKKGSSIEYHLSGNVTAVRLYTFFKKSEQPFILYTSSDGIAYTRRQCKSRAFPYCCANPRDHHYLPVLFSIDSLPINCRFVKIVFPGKHAEAGRCEIDYE